MNEVIDYLVEIWKQDHTTALPEVATLNGNITPHAALAALSSSFSRTKIQYEIEMLLFKIVESYDNKVLSYKQGTSIGLYLRSRGILCASLVGQPDNLYFSQHLLHEMIRTFPVLEWYQTIRRIIESRVAKEDVLYALADGLQSDRLGQVFSSATGITYYAGYAKRDGGTIPSIEHAISKIIRRLDLLLRKPSLPHMLFVSLEAGKRHIDKWR